jgi:hypothetical protein
MSERPYVWAVTFNFYKRGICGGEVTTNVLASTGFKAIALAKKHREELHATEFEHFEIKKLERICEVQVLP